MLFEALDELTYLHSLSISPRYDLSHTDVEDWVGRLLPSRLVRAVNSRRPVFKDIAIYIIVKVYKLATQT